MQKNTTLGVLLVAFGIFLLLNQLNIFSGQSFLAFLGLGFLAVYVLMGGRKHYGNLGFLIPGFVLLALAAFTSGSHNPHLFFLFLSLGFWALLLLHTFWFRGEDWGARFWPFFPAAGLLFFSGMIYSTTVLDWNLTVLNFWNYLVALVLIGIGISLLFKKSPKK